MMKKIISWCLIFTLPAIGLFAAPRIVESAIPSVYYVTPTVKIYENVVNSGGVIAPGTVYRVYASGGFVADGVLAEVGDMVEEGQLLLTVDEAATETLNRNPINAVIDEVSGSVQGGAADILSILSGLGIPGLGIDLDGIAGVMQQDANPAGSRSVLTDDEAQQVFAPASGVVAEVGIVPGGIASPGKGLFTIHDVKSFKVVAAVNEADISKVQIGDRAVIRGAGFPGVSYDGLVTAISPVAYKTLAGTVGETVVDVEVVILNPNNKIRPGFTARVEIRGESRHELITVPYETIRQDEGNNEYVYLYEDGRLVKSHIVTGREMTNEVEVLEGVELDSIVVYNPDDVPGEGAVVRILDRK